MRFWVLAPSTLRRLAAQAYHPEACRVVLRTHAGGQAFRCRSHVRVGRRSSLPQPKWVCARHGHTGFNGQHHPHGLARDRKQLVSWLCLDLVLLQGLQPAPGELLGDLKAACEVGISAKDDTCCCESGHALPCLQSCAVIASTAQNFVVRHQDGCL